VFSRTVTEERVTTRLTCPANYSSYLGTHILRRLVASGFDTTSDPSHPTDDDSIADERLELDRVRRPVTHEIELLEACFRSSITTVRADVDAVIGPAGRVLAVSNNAPDSQCVTDILTAIVFPRARIATRARWHFDYYIEDPNLYVKPLDCP
jgi:hypothetical protein